MSKLRALLILVVTSLACSRITFALFDDPEGPNLLIVVVLAAILLALSWAFYLSRVAPSLAGAKRIAVAITLQIAVAAILYFASI